MTEQFKAGERAARERTPGPPVFVGFDEERE